MDVDQIKGTWSPEEDESLRMLVQQHGAQNWSVISESIHGRSGKSCRLRWFNHLCPGVERQGFTAKEDDVIVEEHTKYGNKLARISRLLNGRTDNSIKNRWNSTLKRKHSSIEKKTDCGSQESAISVLHRCLSSSGSDSSDSNPSPNNRPSTRLTLSLPGTDQISPPRRQPPAKATEEKLKLMCSDLDFLSVMQQMIKKEVRNYMAEYTERR